MTVAALVLVMSLVFVGCDSDAKRIREINEVLATPVAERTLLSAKITTTEIRDGDCINSTLPEGISIETSYNALSLHPFGRNQRRLFVFATSADEAALS